MAIPVTRKESLQYCIQQNYLVFPVRKNKKPAFFGYKEDGKKRSFAYEEDLFKDLEQIEESNYWNSHSNIGIACGFSNLIVIV